MSKVPDVSFNWDSIPVKTGSTADPAAGSVPAVVTVPAGKRWLLCSMAVQCVADANVANRRLTGLVSDGVGTQNGFYANQVQTANTIVNYLMIQTALIPGSLFGDPQPFPVIFPTPLELPAGSTITLSFSNIQAGDNFGPLRYLYKEAPV